MGSSCCKTLPDCENKPEEKKGLLDDTNKGTDSSSKCSDEEPGRVHAGFKKEDGGETDSYGTQDSREIESEPQLDSVLTVVQVNRVVSGEVQNLRTAANEYLEDSAPKAEDGHTTDLNEKISEIGIGNKETGSEHGLYPVPKIENIPVEDLLTLEYLQVEPNTNRAEAGLFSSPRFEDVHRPDLSLKSESTKVADPSFKTELEGGANVPLKSEPTKVDEPFLKCEPTWLDNPFLKSEPFEFKDPSLKSERKAEVQPILNTEPTEVVPVVNPFLKNEPFVAVDAVGTSLKNETVEAVDTSLKNEAVETVVPSLENEAVETVAPSLENEAVETVAPSLENEAVETVAPSLENEAVEAVTPSLENEAVEAVTPSLENEAVEAVAPSLENEAAETVGTSLKNETVEAVDTVVPSLENEAVEAVAPSLENEAVEAVAPSLENEAVEAVAPSLENEAVETVAPSLENEAVETVANTIENETVEAVDTSIENEAVEAVANTTENEAVEAVAPSLENEAVEAVAPSLENEAVEAVAPSLEDEATEGVEPSFKSQTLESEELLIGTQDIKEEDLSPKAVDSPTVDANVVFPDEASPQTTHEPRIGSLSRAAHEEAAELASGTLHLGGDSEEDEDHMSGEGDPPAAVSEASDANDESQGTSSSSQAEKPLLMDEVVPVKSSTEEEGEEEEPEDPEAGMVVPSKDIAQEVEQEVRREEGIGEDVGEEEEEGDASKTTKTGGEGEMMERNSPTPNQEESTNQDSPLTVEVDADPLKPLEASSVDLYLDLYTEDDTVKDGSEPLTKIPLAGVQDRNSVAPEVDILSYSQREWKGNTAKSTLIKKGYSELLQSFESLQRVRGDNYCALRATLFQILSHCDKLPAWIEDDDITLLPEKLAAELEPVESWKFPLGQDEAGEKEGAVEQLKRHLKFLQKTWRAVAEAGDAEERRRLCEDVFQGGAEEHALLEAVKLLMLGSASELHARASSGEEVPVFCWLLFARDDSDCPRAFLVNHLSHVGFSGGLEQVEMFLLGYALQHTIQVYRLYMADTEEFITYYPDDHKDDWPLVCLVTEDDRHYNVLVEKLKGNNVPEAATVTY